jgi:hypothetical protein
MIELPTVEGGFGCIVAAMTPQQRGNLFDLFFSKVRTGPKCWLWQAKLDKDGYGKFQISVPGENRQVHTHAHRLALYLLTGIEAKTTQHRCHREACVRPAHLFWGTQSDNVIDSVRRGTHHSVKLTEHDVRRVRIALKAGNVPASIADRFNISRAMIYAIRAGRCWGWVR